MELISSKLEFGNKNIRVYWNTERKTVVLIVTNQEDTKRVMREDYAPLIYSHTKPKDIQKAMERHIRGLLNAEFDLDIGLDNTQMLVKSLFKNSRKRISAEDVLDEMNNNSFNDIYDKVRKDGLLAMQRLKQKQDQQIKAVEVQKDISNSPKHIIIDYLEEYHQEDLANINLDINTPYDLVIDYNQLEQYHVKIADELLEDPTKVFGYFDKALQMLITSKNVVKIPYNVRFKNLEQTPLKYFLSNKFGQFLETEAIIKGVYEVQHYPRLTKYVCKKCKHELYLFDNRLLGIKEREPGQCPECEYKPDKTSWYHYPPGEIVENEMYILLEEPTDNLTTDEKPRRILARLDGKLIGKVTAGARVKATGILQGYGVGIGHLGDAKKFIFNINNLEHMEDKKVEITDAEMQQILELSKDPNIIDRLIKSFAPNLILDDEVKLAVLCFLVKAGYTANGRDMVHILIISDPSMGKTKLKEYTFNLTEKGIKASGTNASGVGLTGAVDKDPVLNTPMVMPGAIPLANNGHLFIDEFEKMKDEEAKKVLNYMESGMDTIDKWGLHETLHGETSIMALANPLLGRFNKFETVQSQIKIYPPLQSRFDLIIVLEDVPNQEKDKKIAGSILNQYRKESKDETMDDDIIPFDLLKKYLAHARNNYKPEVGQELDNVLIEYQNNGRAGAEEGDVLSFDWRAYESVLRLSGAIAKLRHDNKVNKDDLNRAMGLKKYSFESVGQDPITGKVDIDRVNGNNDNADRTNRTHIKQVLNQYLEENPNIINAMPKKLLMEECQNQPVNGKDKGISENTFYERYRELRKTGVIKEFKANGEKYVKFNL